jgi:2,5-diketo-D-gluconate reductase A
MHRETAHRQTVTPSGVPGSSRCSQGTDPALYDADELAGHRERGVVLEGYSPFKTTDLKDPALTAIATTHGVDAARVVVRWHVQHEVVVIPKSANPERIRTNAQIAFTLSDAEMDTINAL